MATPLSFQTRGFLSRYGVHGGVHGGWCVSMCASANTDEWQRCLLPQPIQPGRKPVCQHYVTIQQQVWDTGVAYQVYWGGHVHWPHHHLYTHRSPHTNRRYSSVQDLGNPGAAAIKVKTQFLEEFMSTRLGVRREADVVSATERTGADGKLYYDIEVCTCIAYQYLLVCCYIRSISMHALDNTS